MPIIILYVADKKFRSLFHISLIFSETVRSIVSCPFGVRRPLLIKEPIPELVEAGFNARKNDNAMIILLRLNVSLVKSIIQYDRLLINIFMEYVAGI